MSNDPSQGAGREMGQLRVSLGVLCDALRTSLDEGYCNEWILEEIERQLGGSDAELIAFVTSAKVWGERGSLVEEASGGRPIHEGFIALGRVQMRLGCVHAYTVGWVRLLLGRLEGPHDVGSV